jgi:hypothetical protein
LGTLTKTKTETEYHGRSYQSSIGRREPHAAVSLFVHECSTDADLQSVTVSRLAC